jgi:hypothetical protein
MIRAFVVIGIIAVVLAFLLYFFNHEERLVKEDGYIKLKHSTVIWPPHVGGPLLLFYKDKLICPSLGGYDPNRYLLTPDSNSILYINYEHAKPEKYELYNINEDSKIIFPNDQYLRLLAGFNGKIEWFDDKVSLTNTDGTQKDILNFKNRTIDIIVLKNK